MKMSLHTGENSTNSRKASDGNACFAGAPPAPIEWRLLIEIRPRRLTIERVAVSVRPKQFAWHPSAGRFAIPRARKRHWLTCAQRRALDSELQAARPQHLGQMQAAGPQHLGLFGQQTCQLVVEATRFVGEVVVIESFANAVGGKPFNSFPTDSECAAGGCEHCRQVPGHVAAAGQLERHHSLVDFAFHAHQTLRHGRGEHEDGAGNCVGPQAQTVCNIKGARMAKSIAGWAQTNSSFMRSSGLASRSVGIQVRNITSFFFSFSGTLVRTAALRHTSCCRLRVMLNDLCPSH